MTTEHLDRLRPALRPRLIGIKAATVRLLHPWTQAHYGDPNMNSTMKAAVVREFGKPLTIEEVAVPQPGPGQIQVKIEASGVCHTDLHAAEGDWPVKPNPPFIPGHEGVGYVSAVGAGVTLVKEGDRVSEGVLILTVEADGEGGDVEDQRAGGADTSDETAKDAKTSEDSKRSEGSKDSKDSKDDESPTDKI